MSFIHLEDGQLHYKITGRGGWWLVFIHGAWASHKWWKWQIPAFSRDHLVLSFDLRGHGQSSPLPQNYSLSGFVKDLSILLKKIEIEGAVLIGWSLGGIIALEYYLQFPQKIKALVLISTKSQRQPPLKRQIWWAYLRARLNLMINLSAPRKYDRDAKIFPDEKDRLENELKQFIPLPLYQEVYGWIKDDLKNYSPRNYLEIAQNLWNWEISQEKLKNISVPTLILVGEKDKITPPPFSEFLHQQIPNSQLIIVKDAGHLLPLEQPEEVNAYIFHFLKSIRY